MITASLRRTYLSAWPAIIYFAQPGCGFAILILNIIGVWKSGFAGGVLIPDFRLLEFPARAMHPIRFIGLAGCCDTVAV